LTASLLIGASRLSAELIVCTRSGVPVQSSEKPVKLVRPVWLGSGAVPLVLRGGRGGAAHDAALAYPHDTVLDYPHRMASFDTALAQSEALNADANTLFGEKRYDEALAKYTTAAELVELHAQRLKEAEAPYCKYLCNRAAAYLGAHKPTFSRGCDCLFQSMVSYALN
jgi:hypothetical protein